MKLVISKIFFIENISQVLVFSTVIFTILYFLVGYFAIPSIDSEPLRDIKFINENLILKIYAFINSFIILILFINIYKKLTISFLMLFTFLWLTLSIFINQETPGPMYFFSILNLYVIFYLYLKKSFRFELSIYTIWVLIIYTGLPILIYVLEPFFNIMNKLPPLFFSDSFRGFSFDRIEYSILLGYLIMILIVEKKYFYLLPFFAYGLFIAESRAAIIALTISVMYQYRNKKKVIIYIVILAITFLIFFSVLSSRSEMGSDGGRIGLYYNTIHQIFNDPIRILFGYGKFYTPVELYNVIPHNWFLQTILNFGMVTLFFWILIIINTWLKINEKGKVFILYSLIVGIFQPGYDAFMFLPFSVLGYYLSIFYGRNKEGKINDNLIT